jgi:hypothetical protein
VDTLRKDNEELRNLIRGKLSHNNDDQSNIPTLNNDNYSTKNFNNLNQTNIIRVNKFKLIKNK